MPQGYCKECRAHVTVRDGACLLGHSIDPTSIIAGSGRHRAARSSRLNHSQLVSPRGAIGVDVLQSEEAPAPSEPPAAPIRRPNGRTSEPRPPTFDTPVEPAADPTPSPAPEPWQRPLLGRRKMPMLELLGFADPGEGSAKAADKPEEAFPAPALLTKPSVIEDATEVIEITPMRGPRLADVHTGEQTENTGVLVARLWDATSTHDALGADWEPSATIEPPVRTFRWSLISAGLALAVTVALLAIAAYRLPINQAAAMRDNLSGSLETLDAATGVFPAVANLVLDPETTTAALADAAIPLLAFSEAANSAYSSATADPGAQIPLVPKAPLEALEPAMTNLQRAADEALVIHERIGDVLDYRILLERALVLPASLPVEASDTRISDIGIGLSATLADTTEVLLQLPQDEILTVHALQLESAYSAMTIHVADYLAALRSGNSFAASRIVGDMRNEARSALDAVDDTLHEFETWLIEAFGHLEQQVRKTNSALKAANS